MGQFLKIFEIFKKISKIFERSYENLEENNFEEFMHGKFDLLHFRQRFREYFKKRLRRQESFGPPPFQGRNENSFLGGPGLFLGGPSILKNLASKRGQKGGPFLSHPISKCISDIYMRLLESPAPKGCVCATSPFY